MRDAYGIITLALMCLVIYPALILFLEWLIDKVNDYFEKQSKEDENLD